MKNKNNKRKWLVISIISLFILICLVVVIYMLYINFKTYSPLEINLSKSNLISVNNNGKYGYIDNKGNLKINYQYEYASDFKGNYAKVKEEDTCYLINTKNKKVISGKTCDDINYSIINATWIINGILYNYKLKQISDDEINIKENINNLYVYEDKNNNKVGLINKKGKIIFAYLADNIKVDIADTDISLIGTYGVIKINDQYGIINTSTGKTIYNLCNDEIIAIGNNIFKLKNNKYIYIEENRITYESNENEVISFYNIQEKILELNTNGNKKYYDLENKTNININNCAKEERKTNEFEYNTDYKISIINGKYGLSKNGILILPNNYNNIINIDYSLYKYIDEQAHIKIVLLEIDNKTIIYDLESNKELYEFSSTNVININSLFIEEDSNNTKTIYSVLSKKSMTFEGEITIASNYIVNDGVIYNLDLKKISIN